MPTEYFEQRERALLGPRYEQLYAAPQEAAERGVTVSALRAMPEQFAQKADFPLEVSPFCKAAFVVHAPEFKPGRHPYHHAGVFYSQEPSASSAAPLLGVQPGMRVLDLCAAPGGKSSQLAAALQGRGVLVSNEYVAARAEILKSNLERMGVPNAVVLNETPARIAEALPEFFDRVLVDDSIVRGTTSARIIKLLRDAGAAEVHFMVSAPPFKYPCYFGTDIPDQKLLVATGRTLEQINEVIGADTLGYLSNEHVVQLAKNAKCGFCTACFTGEYAVEPESVLSTDIHDRHLNDRPKDAKKLGE